MLSEKLLIWVGSASFRLKSHGRAVTTITVLKHHDFFKVAIQIVRLLVKIFRPTGSRLIFGTLIIPPSVAQTLSKKPPLNPQVQTVLKKTKVGAVHLQCFIQLRTIANCDSQADEHNAMHYLFLQGRLLFDANYDFICNVR